MGPLLLVLSGAACVPATPSWNGEPGLSAAQRGEKTIVCHLPGGVFAKANDLFVDSHSVGDHLAHGDSLGPCPIRLAGALVESGVGQQGIWGVEAAIQWIDGQGGLFADGQTRLVVFDHEDTALAPYIEEACANDTVAALVAPYGSTATGSAVDIALASNCAKPLLIWGGASEDILGKGYGYAVQSLTPAGQYHTGILDLTLQDLPLDAKIAFAYEDDAFTASVAVGAVERAEGLTIVLPATETYPDGGGAGCDAVHPLCPEVGAFVASHASDLVLADLILGGGHLTDTLALASALKDEGNGIDPAVLSLLVAPASSEFCDREYADRVSGPAQWDPAVSYVATCGPQQGDFLALFDAVSGGVAAEYQAIGAAASVFTWAQAVEEAGTTEAAAVMEALSALQTTTLFGDFDIDETGLQVGHSMVHIQCQDGQKVVVYPDTPVTVPYEY